MAGNTGPEAPRSPTREAGTQSALYKRMTVVMHCIIFLYAAAFWIQIGVMPVSFIVYCNKTTQHGLEWHFLGAVNGHSVLCWLC